MPIVEKFKALSCETRYNIYNLLRQRQMSIEEISKLTNLKPITVRHHISELERSGLVCKRLNRFSLVGRPSVVYGVNSDILETSLTTRNYAFLQKIFFTSIQDFFKDSNKLLEFYNFMAQQLAHTLLSGFNIKEFSNWDLKDLKERVFLERFQEYAPMPEIVEETADSFTIRLYTCPFLEHNLPFFDSICRILSDVYIAEIAKRIGFIDILIMNRRSEDKPFCEFKVSLKKSKTV